MYDTHNILMILTLLLPLVGSAFSLVEKTAPKFRVSRFIAPGTLLAALICLLKLYPSAITGKRIIYLMGNWGPPFGITLVMDGIAWLGSFIVLSVAIPVLIYASNEKTHTPFFYFCYQIMTASMIGLILTDDIFNMFVFLEIMAIASYMLISCAKRARAIMASLKYLLISSLGISFFLVGIFILYRLTGTLSLEIMSERIQDGSLSDYQGAIVTALACLIVGIGVRIALVPFHTWLPEAYAFAPHPVSALLAAATTKSAFIALWRIISAIGGESAGNILVWAGSITALLGVTGALAQYNMKKLLAFHSISQMGYIIAAFGVGTCVSMTGSYYHILSHALFKSLLFLSIGSVIHATGRSDLRQLGNLNSKLPMIAIPFFIGALAISGIPPFNGYVSKKLIATGLSGNPAYPIIWITGVLTIASFIKLSVIFRKRAAPIAGTETNMITSGPPGCCLPLWILAAACLATGIAPSFFTIRFAALISGLTGSEAQQLPGITAALPLYHISGLLDVAPIIILGYLMYRAAISERAKKAFEKISHNRIGFHKSILLLTAGFLILWIFLTAHG